MKNQHLSQSKTYGPSITATELDQFLNHLTQPKESPTPPLCIWGEPGIGKTTIVESFCADHKIGFTYVAPAQFEEMGDLLGMPVVDGNSTVFAPPKWVPLDEGPGILLLDDVNRADERILKGIMQLLQRSALMSWQLPKNWTIILTANPDYGDYQVTRMDEALLTRMLHVTLEFDLDSWVDWAEATKLNEQGVAFMKSLSQESFDDRTNPRTITNFFQELDRLSDSTANPQFIRSLIHASIGNQSAEQLYNFLFPKGELSLTGKEILRTNNFIEKIKPTLIEISKLIPFPRDKFQKICQELIEIIKNDDFENIEMEKSNLKEFLLFDQLPGDLRFNLFRELANSKSKKWSNLLQDKEVQKLIY